MATGLSLIASTPASASTDATLSATSTIKGVTVVSLGTPGTSPNNVAARGTIHISTAAASDISNSGAFITNFITRDPAASIDYVWKHAFGGNLMNQSTYNGSAAISNGDIFSIFVISSGGMTNVKYYLIDVQVSANGSSPSSSSSSSSAQSAAATAAATAAAVATAFGAGLKLTKTVGAQQNLSSAFLGNKSGSIEDFRSANINVTTTASLNRINAEILKLSVADRTDFVKIKVLAEKIEFDESFFNATSRPTAATYATYGVPGVTERVVAKVNEKVLELPAAQRLDTKAITEIANVESFIDRVANPATRSSVSASLLISKGLMPADYPKKISLIQGLGSYPEGSLNTLAKIEAAIKEVIAKAEAPRSRTAEIRAKIAARNK